MPPLSEFFGSLERLLGELYPYRVPLALGALVVLGAVLVAARRRGVDAALLRWTRLHRGLTAVLAMVALAVAIPLGNYTLSPLWTRTALSEASPLPANAPGASSSPATTDSAATPRVVRAGALAGADAFHFGRGQVQLIDTGDGRRILRFEGLSVRNGPDLFVYLSADAEGVQRAVNLGGLRATDGSFNYEVPADVDGATLDHALIWCRQFGVLFASASLAAP